MAVEHRAKLKTNHSHNMAADQTLKFYTNDTHSYNIATEI